MLKFGSRYATPTVRLSTLDAFLDDLFLDLFGLVDHSIKLVDILDESLSNAGFETFLLVDQCVNRVSIVFKSVHRNFDMVVVITPAPVKALSHSSNAQVLIG